MSGLNLEAYFRARPDVIDYIRDARQAGIDTGKEYEKKYGKKTSGWEQDWLDKANKMYGRSAADVSEFSEDELGRLHYQNWGRNEGTLGSQDYKNIESGLSEDERRLGALRGDQNIDEKTRKELLKANFEKQYTPSSFDMGEFEGLLGRLEGSKMRQQRQKSVEGRRDIMAGGLAGMMNNF